MTELRHLRLENTAQTTPYTYAGPGGRGKFQLPPRDRFPHAEKLKNDLDSVLAEIETIRSQQGFRREGDGDVVAVRSEAAFDLKLDSLERLRSGIELVSVSVEDGVTVAKLFVPRGKHVLLLNWINSYATAETRSGRPKNQLLIESITSIKLAAIHDFWEDDENLFPSQDETIWWEIWLRLSGREPRDVYLRFAALARECQIHLSDQFISFPERVVTLGRASPENFGRSIDLLSAIAELRRAKELASDYLELTPTEQSEFVEEVLKRLVPPANEAPAVCILDTGVNRGHPLLAPALSEDDAHSVKPVEWGKADDRRQHGTGMAGIALYGCLTDVLASRGPVTMRHRLESVKILPPPPGSNEEKDYGPFTVQAVARVEIQAPERNRAICMAVTADDRDLGMPSLWSATVDQICAGALDDRQRLMLISAGNVRDILDPGYSYHRSNSQQGIEDPGQAWNSLTVGAFTEKVLIQDPAFLGWRPIAQSGDLCPTSRTSLSWPEDNQKGWPIKPDIVMEGGNYAENDGIRSNCPDLSLLTTTLPSGSGRLFEITSDTSPATASAARVAAVIWSYYPRFRPETVRGLMVHSAEWTKAMLDRYPRGTKTQAQKRLRCFGYGTPNLSRALWSAENAATLIFEGDIHPYQKVDATIRSNEMHVHRLPWPTAVLEDLSDADVRMKVTLSYFVEPSPGRIGWAEKHRYQSHGLRFEVNRPLENEEALRQRLSREEWERPEERPDNASETRNWDIGDRGRRHGSIHSDSWTGSASELASCNLIAIYPVTGWWRERQHLGRWSKEARYSLIVTIETKDLEVDLYNAIANQVAIPMTWGPDS